MTKVHDGDLSQAEAPLNGIDLDTVRDAQHQMRIDPEGTIARPVHAATVVWEAGYRTRTKVSGGMIVEGDEPPAYGGAGRGATPQELLLTAVGHCLSATYVGGLTSAGIPVRSLTIHVSGRVNFRAAYGVESGNAGFDRIKIDVDIDADAPKDKVESLLAKLLPTAPIPDTIQRPVPIEVDFRYANLGSTTENDINSLDAGISKPR